MPALISVYLVWLDGERNFLGFVYSEGSANKFWGELLHSGNKFAFVY